MSQEKPRSKCIYCQTVLTNRNRSKEHVVNRSILPKYNNKLTLTRKVCKPCNNGFGEIDTAFTKNTLIGFNRTAMDIMNNEDRWDSSQEPFVIKNLTTTIKGDKQVFTIETDKNEEQNILRGIAKIALNGLIYDLKGEPFEVFKDEKGNCHYICARNDDIFNGNEESLSDIKKFIKEGGKFPGHIERERIPLEAFNENMSVQGRNIPMDKIKDPTHIIVIYKAQSHYYAVAGLFIGLDETTPLYFISLIGDKNEKSPDYITPEVVRVYNFGHLIKKQPKQEPIRSYIIHIPKDNSAYLIQPVNNPEWIHIINTHRNN